MSNELPDSSEAVSERIPIGAVAIGSDIVARRTRDWTHWAGVILWLLVQAESLSIGLYYIYLWRIA